jgi:hypothetical protein
MKKFSLSALVAVASALLMIGTIIPSVFQSTVGISDAQAATANYGDRQYALTVHDERSGSGREDGRLTTGVYVFVYDAGTKTLSTIYSDRKRTAKTNPISRSQYATDTQVYFFGPNSSYDIALAHSDGSTAKFTSIAPTSHRLYLPRQGQDKTLVFSMVFNAGATETDTGLDLPYGALVYDAGVETVTVDATETVDVGLLSSETAGDADGFVAAVSVAAAGIPALFTYTTGANEVYLSAVTYGVLLAARSLGTDVATDVGSFGKLRHYVTGSNATSVTYTPSTSDTFAGYGYVHFKNLR